MQFPCGPFFKKGPAKKQIVSDMDLFENGENTEFFSRGGFLSRPCDRFIIASGRARRKGAEKECEKRGKVVCLPLMAFCSKKRSFLGCRSAKSFRVGTVFIFGRYPRFRGGFGVPAVFILVRNMPRR